MRFFNDWNSRRRLRSSGQALILIVLTFIGLLLFLGLMIDLGQIFLAKGYLRRAADAASLAAAAQFRESRTIEEMETAAREVAHMNGVDPTSIWVQTCKDGDPGPDATLCPKAGDIPKKLVRVTIQLDYPLTFLSLLNIYSVHLTESSVSEAASMDVVLVIDISESMNSDNSSNGLTYDQDIANPMVCNGLDQCHPFKEVKNAADLFAQKILNKPVGEEEDRLAIVTFANGWQAEPYGTQILPMSAPSSNWTDDYNIAKAYINGLRVYEPEKICPYGKWECPGGAACPNGLADIPTGPCLYVSDDDKLVGVDCARAGDGGEVSTLTEGSYTQTWAAMSACDTTNIGGGLMLAGEQFNDTKRPNALWVVVLLTDGAANATFGVPEDINQVPGFVIKPVQDPGVFVPNFEYGFCPPNTWYGPGQTGYGNRVYCQDGDVTTYHFKGSGAYDADDFARDMARYVGCFADDPASDCYGWTGQGAVIFTIGLGDAVTDVLDDNGKPYGAELLRFVAGVGEDGDPDPATNPCTSEPDYTVSCGNYFYAQGGANLNHVFELIYSRIFTRLTQ
jgi:Flp pilus assembly protein TadG